MHLKTPLSQTFVGAGPVSRAAFARACGVLAGGVDSPVRAGVPMGGTPPVVAGARGSTVTDVDGNRYIDYLCGYGPVLLGHADPAIAAAVRAAADGSLVFGATHEEEARLAERIRAHLPSMERLRFVSTGTEACMSAVRLARACTGKTKIVRFEGNYHGHSDEMIFSAGASSLSSAGIEAGITAGAASNVIVLPYGDVPALEACLRANAGDIAAIILEPVCANMGLVQPGSGHLQSLRDAATEAGALLIFDEIITGFRLGLSGAQGMFGVCPDLTCIGKTLGGGTPIAAFGGREDVMARLAPSGRVFQGGTFSGNPLCVAAAHAMLDRLEGDPAFYTELDAMGVRLADGAKKALGAAGLSYPVVQLGSIVDFMFRGGPAPHLTYAQAREADAAAYARYYWAMMREGVFLPPSPMEVMFLTAAHTVEDVDTTIAAMHAALAASVE